MSVYHYLFWKNKNKITAILKNTNDFEIIKIGGNCATEYTDDYWDKWREYAGFLKDDQIDFCIVFDDECPKIPKELQARECSDEECIWDKYMIQRGGEIMDIVCPTRIFNKEGCCIAKFGSFRGVEDSGISNFFAVYRNSNKDFITKKSESNEITPFIESMLRKLEELDNQ